MSFDILGYPEPMVSGARPYRAELVRLVCGDDTPGGPGVKEELVPDILGQRVQGRRQELHVGSFGLVECPGALFDARPDFTFACRFFPTIPGEGKRQILAGRFDGEADRGWRLEIDGDGRLRAVAGSAVLLTPFSLPAREWYHAGLSFDRGLGSLRLTVTPLRPFPAGGTAVDLACEATDAVRFEGLPLVLAAGGHDAARLAVGQAHAHYNGKIEAPCLFARALAPDEVRALARSGLPQAGAPGLLAAWDLSQDIPGDRMIDVGLNSCHGTLINLPTRGVTSSGFDASAMSWTEKPAHFAAVHFHDDDFEDARWETDFAIDLPAGLKSGVYAARLTPLDKPAAGDRDVERVIFFVGAPRGRASSPIAYLASTCTYMAYANSHYATDMANMEPKRGTWMVIGAAEAFLNDRREFGLSPYDTHSDGSGVCYSSRRRPLFSMRVKQRLWTLNADTHITEWLEAKGFDYDVITDEHIHREGASVLDPYRVVITGTHPEYWSTRMLDSLEAWQTSGGRLMYLGGNGFYWRTAYHPDKPWLIEVRRAESGARYWETAPGEAYHSFTGEYGGLWRRLGRAPQRYTGIGTQATGFDFSSYYRRKPGADDPRAAFIFAGVPDEIIGDFGLVGGGAAGSEIDAVNHEIGTPSHALVLASSENHSRYVLLAPEVITSSIANHNGEENPDVRADMVFYETVNGGAVFSTGSITWCASFFHNGHDNNVSRITENVLVRFADPAPFEQPALAGGKGPRP